jgi:hypothetical protein
MITQIGLRSYLARYSFLITPLSVLELYWNPRRGEPYVAYNALSEETFQMRPAEKPDRSLWHPLFFLVLTASGSALMR